MDDATTAPEARFFGGIDENGLGPRLGPLSVTGVLARTDSPQAAQEAVRPAAAEMAALIGDSKRLVGFGHSALGEAWARVLFRAQGLDFQRPSELIRQLSLDAPDTLQTRCPAEAFPLCWRPFSDESDRFEAGDEVLARAEAARQSLLSRGIRLEAVRSVIICPRALNDARDSGISRLDADLFAMERLFLAMKQRAGEDARLTVHCGKVGGLTFYASKFRHIRLNILGVLRESRGLSAYESGRAQIHFVLDAEPKHQLVGLASLVGKWLRDLLMNRLLSHLRAGHPDWPEASGYNDPRTKSLIALSEPWRRAQGIPDDCFLRR